MATIDDKVQIAEQWPKILTAFTQLTALIGSTPTTGNNEQQSKPGETDASMPDQPPKREAPGDNGEENPTRKQTKVGD